MVKFLLSFFCLIILTCQIYAQNPGVIVNVATGSGATVLDPNGDGYVSQTTSGFTTSDRTESEIPFSPMAFPQLEPSGDQSAGNACGTTDIVDSGDQDPAMCYYDGTNLFFRIRTGSTSPSPKGYSVLIDTDEKFGSTGPDADTNYTTDNPGFEIEICLKTNVGLSIYNVDGACPDVAAFTYSGSTAYQRSMALTTVCGNADYFVDFFVPFADLQSIGVTITAGLRIIVTSQNGTAPAICNTAISDIGGIDDNDCGGFNGTCLTDLITNFTPTPVTGMTATIPDRSLCPAINNNIAAGATFVTGTCPENDGAYVLVYKNGNLIDSTIVSSGSWSLNGISPVLAVNDTITAATRAPGESLSPVNCDEEIVSNSCSPAITNSRAHACAGRRGFNGDANSAIPGAIINVYDNSGNLLIPTAGTLYSSGTITVNVNGSWVWKCNNNNNCGSGSANCISAGTYRITQTVSGQCESQPVLICTGTTGSSTAPVITSNPTYNDVTVSGTALANSSVYLYNRNDTVYTLLGSTTANISGSWSISQLTLNGCDTLTTQAIQASMCLSTNSMDVVVTNGTSTAPFITGSYCVDAPITTVWGTSIEDAGSQVQVFENGIAEGSTTTVSANGTWTATAGINIIPGSTITAKATGLCKTQSASSFGVVSALRTNDPLLSITSNPVYEGMTSISGTATAGNTVTLYADGSQIGNTVATAGNVWTITGLGTTDIYTDASLSATSTEPGKCESTAYHGPVVQCTSPEAGLAVTPSTADICVNATTVITVNASQAGVIYQLYAQGSPTGSALGGNGGILQLTTGSISSEGYVTVHALKSGTACETFLNDSIEIIFDTPLMPVITTPGEIRFCEGDTIMLVSSYTGGNSWSNGQITDSIVVTLPGNYSVIYSNASGCTSTGNYNLILNTNPPQPSINNAAIFGFCLGDSLLLTTDYTPGLIYQWRKYGNNLSQGDTTLCMIYSPGKYRVRVTDTNGCTNISPYYQVISDPIKPNLLANGSTQICIGGNVLLATDTLAGISHQWRKFGIPIPGATSYQYLASDGGKYSCVATDTNGCSRASDPIEITLTPDAPVISATGNTQICIGDSVQLNVTPIPGMTYEWKKSGNALNGAAGTSFYATQEGQYKCVISNANGCTRSSNGIMVTYTPLMPLIAAQGPTVFCPGDSVVLEATTITGVTYQWLKNNIIIAGAMGNLYTAKLSGRYKCRVTDINGCARNSLPLDITASCKLDGYHGKNSPIIRVYPNPSFDDFNIVIRSQEADIKITLKDISGRPVQADIIKLPQGLYKISGLDQGVYVATIETMGISQLVKLIKTR